MSDRGNNPATADPAGHPREGSRESWPLLAPAIIGNDGQPEPCAREMRAFFTAKGLPALKEEDRREQWYADWVDYQARHHIYARLLSPRQYSALGIHFDILRYSRFLELFAYWSPAHGYSLQVNFLGLFAILAGTNEQLKREAIMQLEAGGLFALGVSEKEHGADLMATEFAVAENSDGKLTANGSKYYIGNCNCAAMISILGRRAEGAGRGLRRAPFVLFALRPKGSPGFAKVQKIRTLGVRSAFVGEFEVKDHPLPAPDLIAQGRDAWDAIFRTVTLGKFFLGFGAIGICEHAFAEAAQHLSQRILYGKPAIRMPHLGSTMAQAYARLSAMKLFAYRALDYVRAASGDDRRYLLFCAVQKAKVSTEGVKVMALLSECIGARGFNADTYFEMALRDIQLIPGLEGSTHINLALAAQFIPQYFKEAAGEAAGALRLPLGDASGENPYLMIARTGAIGTIAFRHFLDAYQPLSTIENVRLFSLQARTLSALFQTPGAKQALADDQETSLAFGNCQAIVAYGQLIAEQSSGGIAPPLIAAMFHLLINDLSALAQALSANPRLDSDCKILLEEIIVTPQTTATDWEAVAQRAAEEVGEPR